MSLALNPLFFLAVATLAGCATMSSGECTQADWRLVGFADGAKGLAQSRIGAHGKACSKAGVTPDLDRYLLGHREGAKTYCTPTNGFNLGSSGGADSGVCEAFPGSGFQRAWAAGHQRFEVQRRVTTAEAELDRLFELEARLIEESRQLEAQIVSAQSTPASRVDSLEQLRQRQVRLEALEDDKAEYFFALDSAREDLRTLVAEQARAGWH